MNPTLQRAVDLLGVTREHIDDHRHNLTKVPNRGSQWECFVIGYLQSSLWRAAFDVTNGHGHIQLVDAVALLAAYDELMDVDIYDRDTAPDTTLLTLDDVDGYALGRAVIC